MSSTQLENAGVNPTRPWPADQQERWPIERLTPYPNNARLHSETDLDKLAASILKFGWTMPPLVDEQGALIVGQGRVEAAATRLGIKEVPVLVARGWSEEEKRAYRVADNQLAARASWDFERLSSEFGDLKLSGFDLDLIGFRAGSAQGHPRLFETERSNGSGQRTGSPRSTGQPARRRLAIGRPPDWLRRQYTRDGCRASTGRIAASLDGHRSTLRGRLRAVLASAPRPRFRQACAGQSAQR